jgi:hypothetical protein
MDSIKKDTLTHSHLSTTGEKLFSQTSKPKVEQIVAKDASSNKADLESIKNCLRNVKDLKGKEALMQAINEKFIDKKTLNPSLFKQVYSELKSNKNVKLADRFIAKKLSSSPEKDQMLLSVFRDPSVWTKNFLDDDYKCFLKAIQDTASRDEAYSIIGKHCDDITVKLKISNKIQDTSIKDSYILSILEDRLDYETAIQLAEALSRLEGRNQAYAKLAKAGYSPNEKLEFIINIQDAELKKEACLSLLNSPNLKVDLQLQAIGLIPDELCAINGISKDNLRSAIAQNADLSDWDRYTAFSSLASDDRGMEVLKYFDQKPSLFTLLVSQAKLLKNLSQNLLNFYFFNKDQSLGRSFQDLLQMACNLDISHEQAYPGSKVFVCDSDAGLISLALNESFPLEERFIAFQHIQNLEARLEMSELKTFLHAYVSSHTLPQSSILPRFELLSEKDFCSDIALLLVPNEQQARELYNLIQSYHAIPKDVKGLFNDRIALLKSVSHTAQTILKGLSDHQDSTPSPLQAQQIQSLQSIQAQADQKARYLKKIPKLKQKALDRISSAANAKYGLPKEMPILNVLGDVARNLDPLKRKKLDKLVTEWGELAKNYPATPNFWVWLETQTIPSLEHDYRYTLFTKEQKLVQFQAGLACNPVFGNKNDNNRLEGNYLYNIGQDGNLYILPYRMDEGKRFTHDMILKGKNILSAGIVKFKKGKITDIDVDSGHYEPNRFKNLKAALAYFSEKNPSAIHLDTQVGGYGEHYTSYSYAAFKDMEAPKDEKEREPVFLEELGFKSKKPSSLT